MTLLSAVEQYDDTPIDRYLAAQADLTAVERFAQRHAADALPAQARYYRSLLPASAPGPGQQYGFNVDLDACTGCKACVTACHSLNGLDDGESWRRVTLVDTGAGPQHITAACHHCVDPACLKGCPVDAYEKDPVTGIVTHLDDQCIGCSYCTLTCPYDVPVYNKARGIVRKCDMCRDRLAEGEAPACVQGCPNDAISVTVVDIAEVRTASPTRPTTAYTRRTPFSTTPPDVQNGEHRTSHTPLAVMLVLTQLAVGAFLAGGARLAVPAAAVAMGASVFHLGRPQYFYRSIIGLRHSWLSREVVAFGAFFGLALLHAVRPHPVLGTAAAAAGLAGVGCSVLIYAVTGRPQWRVGRVTVDFAVTTALSVFALSGATLPLLALTALTPVFRRQRDQKAWPWRAAAGVAALLLSPAVALPLVGWAELRDRQAFFA